MTIFAWVTMWGIVTSFISLVISIINLEKQRERFGIAQLKVQAIERAIRAAGAKYPD